MLSLRFLRNNGFREGTTLQRVRPDNTGHMGYSDLPFALDQGLQADEKRGFYCIMYI